MDALATIVADRYASQEEVRYLTSALQMLGQMERYLAGFPRVLASAQREDRTGLNPGEVWQDQFSRYWGTWSSIGDKLMDVAYELEGFEGYGGPRASLVYDIQSTFSESAHNPRNKRRVQYAFAEPLWRPHLKKGRDHIAYAEDRLQDWHKAATAWVKESQTNAKKAMAQAKRRKSARRFTAAKRIVFPNQVADHPEDMERRGGSDWARLGLRTNWQVQMVKKRRGEGFATEQQARQAAKAAAKQYERDRFPGGTANVEDAVAVFEIEPAGPDDPDLKETHREYFGLYSTFYSPS